MNKLVKVSSSLAIASTLLLGTGAVAQSPAQAATKVVKPYYNYKGYVKYDTKFLVDKDFVRALNYDNIKINGYKLNLKGDPGRSTKNFMKYDTYYAKDHKNRVTLMRPIPKKNVVKLSTFMKAHKDNKLVKKGKGVKAGMYEVRYQTKGGATYTALFEKGYLSYFEYGIYEK